MKDETFEDTGYQFFEQFVLIAEALNEQGMWNEEGQVLLRYVVHCRQSHCSCVYSPSWVSLLYSLYPS